jgi:hypothetical protein
MKKIYLLFIVLMISLSSFAQRTLSAEEKEEKNNQYLLTIGLSKLSASYDTYGFEIKENELRIVGLLYRGNKLAVDELTILTRVDDKVVDSQYVSCGKNAKWKDMYVHLKDLAYSESYSISVYSAANGNLLKRKDFYIRQK